MQLKLILKYFKTAFKNFKVFTGLRLHHLNTSMGGRVGGWPGGWLDQGGNKANIQPEFELS